MAVGYTLFIALWLIFRDRVPSESEATGVAASLYSLAQIFGRGATIAALSFICYLVGSAILISRTPRWVLGLGWIGRSSSVSAALNESRLAPLRINAGQLVGRTGDPALHALIPEAVSEELAHMDERARADELAAYLQHRVQLETQTAVSRLQVKSPPLYDAYDRLMAEAELRLSLFVPLLGLIAVLAILWEPWAALLMVIPLVLAYQGARKEVAARRLLDEAFADGLVESATMERLNAWLDKTPGK